MKGRATLFWIFLAAAVGFGLFHVKYKVQALEEELARLNHDIIQDQEQSQFGPWVVTNGDKAGILANHCNNLTVYLEDARQKMGSLMSILKQG